MMHLARVSGLFPSNPVAPPVNAAPPAAAVVQPTEPTAVSAPDVSSLADRMCLKLVDGHSHAVETHLSTLGFRACDVATDAGRLRCLQMGAQNPGPAWIFLHGMGSQATDWAPMLRPLATRPGIRIIAVDLPGHGRSDTPRDSSVHPELLLTSLRQVLAALLKPTDTCILVGNSMGGYGAIKLAQRLPRQVKQLILIAPLGAPMDAAARQRIARDLDIRSHAQALAFVDALFIHGFNVAGPRCFDFAMRHAYARCFAALYRQPYLRALVRQVETHPFLTAADMRNLPAALVIWGERDHVLPATCGDFFAATLPPQDVVRVADFSHSPFLDQSPDVLRIIDDWRATR